VGVLFDPDDALDEANEHNNAAAAAGAFTIGDTTPGAAYPDLAAWDVTLSSYSGDPGDSVTVDYVISNNTDHDAGAFDVSIRLSTDRLLDAGDPELCSDSFGGLGARSSGEESATCALPSLSAGDYYLGVLVDPDDEVVEWREFNNQALDPTPYTLDPSATRDADLLADDVALSVTSGAAGDPLDVVFERVNDGETAVTATYQVAVYFSLDDTIDPSDTEICSDDITGDLDPGEVNEKTMSHASYGCAVPDLPAGSWYVGVYMDRDDDITEWNEANNGAAATHLFFID